MNRAKYGSKAVVSSSNLSASSTHLYRSSFLLRCLAFIHAVYFALEYLFFLVEILHTCYIRVLYLMRLIEFCAKTITLTFFICVKTTFFLPFTVSYRCFDRFVRPRASRVHNLIAEYNLLIVSKVASLRPLTSPFTSLKRREGFFSAIYQSFQENPIFPLPDLFKGNTNTTQNIPGKMLTESSAPTSPFTSVSSQPSLNSGHPRPATIDKTDGDMTPEPKEAESFEMPDAFRAIAEELTFTTRVTSKSRVAVYCVSDLHADAQKNQDWVRSKCTGHTPREEDQSVFSVFILPGDIGTEVDRLSTIFEILTNNYDAVCYCVGNHESWRRGTASGGSATNPELRNATTNRQAANSVDKIVEVLQCAKSYGVFVGPLRIITTGDITGDPSSNASPVNREIDRSKGVVVMPLQSWYHSGFDKEPEIDHPLFVDVQKYVPFEKKWGDFVHCLWPGVDHSAFASITSDDKTLARSFAQLNEPFMLQKVSEESKVTTCTDSPGADRPTADETDESRESLEINLNPSSEDQLNLSDLTIPTSVDRRRFSTSANADIGAEGPSSSTSSASKMSLSASPSWFPTPSPPPSPYSMWSKFSPAPSPISASRSVIEPQRSRLEKLAEGDQGNDGGGRVDSSFNGRSSKPVRSLIGSPFIREDDTLITFSHFLPRQELIPEKRFLLEPHLTKVIGSDILEGQIRRLHPDLHLFGHSHIPIDLELDGIRYIQWPLGYFREADKQCKPIYSSGPLLIFDSALGDGSAGIPSKLASEEAAWTVYYNERTRSPENLSLAPWVIRRLEEFSGLMESRKTADVIATATATKD